MTYAATKYLGAAHSTTRAKCEDVLTALDHATGKTLTHCWGYDPNPSNTEHHSGNAVDFMVFSDRAAGDFIADYLWRNAGRLGLVHLIWRQRIRSTQTQPGVWRAMADRGSPTENHLDHVHVLFTGAPLVTSAATTTTASGPTSAPGPSSAASAGVLRPGTRGAEVRQLQAELNRLYPRYSRLDVDGIYGNGTAGVVLEFQRRSGLDVDGVAGPATLAALRRAGARV